MPHCERRDLYNEIGLDMTKINYRMDAQTGKPWKIYPNHAVVLNDDGSTVTEHYDENGRLYKTTANVVPYPEDWKAT